MDLGKVTVFSGSPPDDKKRLLQNCSRNVGGQVFATCHFLSFSTICLRRSPSCAQMAVGRTLQWKGQQLRCPPDKRAPHFENRVFFDGHSDGSWSCVYVRLINIFALFFLFRWKFSLRWIQAYLISKITPDGATWRPCNSRLYGRLNFGCVWAFFSARLPSFPLSFNRNSFYSRYSWLSMAICVLSESTWPGCRPRRWQRGTASHRFTRSSTSTRAHSR